MLQMTTEISDLVKALRAFQAEIVTVERTVTNPFFKSKYADLASIMKESQPILTNHQLAISQFLDSLDGKPALTTMLMHESGQFIVATIPLIMDKQDPQGLGRAITYTRRYGYAAVLQIVIDEDNDGNSPKTEKPQPSNPVIAAEIERIWKEKGGTEETLVAWVKKNNNDMLLNQLSGDRQAALLTYLQKRKAEKSKKPTETPESLEAADTQDENPGADPGSQENK